MELQTLITVSKGQVRIRKIMISGPKVKDGRLRLILGGKFMM